ncbi:glycoside hydrolase, partial [Delitschia confertaspora ATCC 74209]
MGSASSTAYTGFNYGVRWGNQTVKTYDDFLRQFTLAQSLSSGTSGLVNSARLFTTLQPVDQEPAHDSSKPTVAIKAAIETGTYLLVGLWASALEKELVALNEALKIYGEDFTKLIIGISVGNEDLYRNSTRCLSGCYDGANNEALTSYIQGVRRNLTNGPYSKNLTGIPIGHVDTQVNWLEATKELINANDFIGVNAYPYWYNASISNSKDSFFDALQKVEGKINHKPIWITETGWPASGPTQGKAVASVENARRYWKDVGCLLFGKYNTFWFEL